MYWQPSGTPQEDFKIVQSGSRAYSHSDVRHGTAAMDASAPVWWGGVVPVMAGQQQVQCMVAAMQATPHCYHVFMKRQQCSTTSVHFQCATSALCKLTLQADNTMATALQGLCLHHKYVGFFKLDTSTSICSLYPYERKHRLVAMS